MAIGRPRYWVDAWDRWHLALPVLTLACLIWLLTRPRPPGVVRPPATAAATGAARPVGSPVTAQGGASPQRRVLAPPVVERPANGDRLPPPGRSQGEVSGRSIEPGVRVGVLYRPAGGQERFLTVGRTDNQGRFRFGLEGFAPGTYVLRVALYADDKRTSVSGPIEVTVAAR